MKPSIAAELKPGESVFNFVMSSPEEGSLKKARRKKVVHSNDPKIAAARAKFSLKGRRVKAQGHEEGQDIENMRKIGGEIVDNEIEIHDLEDVKSENEPKNELGEQLDESASQTKDMSEYVKSKKTVGRKRETKSNGVKSKQSGGARGVRITRAKTKETEVTRKSDGIDPTEDVMNVEYPAENNVRVSIYYQCFKEWGWIEVHYFEQLVQVGFFD